VENLNIILLQIYPGLYSENICKKSTFCEVTGK